MEKSVDLKDKINDEVCKTDPIKYERLCQGDVISSVSVIEHYSSNENKDFELILLEFPNVIIISQDCDLEQDYNNRINPTPKDQDKLLFSVLVAPLYPLEPFRNGVHLKGENIDQLMEYKNSKDINIITQNREPRYHYCKFSPEPPIVVPSIVDFKHYFSIPILMMVDFKKNGYRGKISELYREKISHRFAFYLSRIGLPPATP